MKTKLLSLALLCFCTILQAQWSQVGNQQFTGFTSDVQLTFNNSTGQPYILYQDVATNHVIVKHFDGVNWNDVGAVISTLSYDNFDINVNPVTNEPWVVLKRSGNGTSSSGMDVFRYDGTAWVQEATNQLFNTGLRNRPVQLQFNASGVARVAGLINGGNFELAAFATFNATNNWTINNGRTEPNIRLDFTDYDNYFYTEHYSRFSSFEGRVRKHTVLNNSSADIFDKAFYPARTLEVSGIAGTNYFVTNDIVAYNATTNPTPYPNIIFGNGTANPPQPINTQDNTNNIIKFRESITDNGYYLMFSDANENLVFQKFKGSAWSVLPAIGINTSNSGFFVDMETNPVNGDMYVAYWDSGRISVQKFAIAPPLSKYYVNTNVSGGNGSGDSWTNAMTELSDALGAAGAGTTEIWVAAGTYKPGASRSDSFDIFIDGLNLYGGFDGTETNLSERDVMTNTTILSGDLNDNDAGHGSGTRGDNSYHIMNILQADNVIIDGFQISYGHANGTSTNAYGGAINVGGQSENLIVRNCEFYQNFGLTGGAIRSYLNVNTSMTFENCVFDDNLSRYGSGMYFLVNANRTVSLDIVNCLFTNNRTYDVNTSSKGFTGSALWARANTSGSNLTTTITNCTFANNLDQGTQSGSERGAIGLGRRTDGNSTHNATINNSIFYYNDQGTSNLTGVSINKGHTALPNTVFVNNSISEDSFSNLSFLTNTSNSDPLFTDAANNDFTLQSASPAIDAGDNALVPSGITIDLLGNQRIFNTTVDMGAYEFGSTTLGTDDVIIENGLKIYPNPTSSILNIKTNTDLENIAVYNLQGQKVLESTKNTIDVSTMAKGMYVIKVQTISGGILIKRFIKE